MGICASFKKNIKAHRGPFRLEGKCVSPNIILLPIYNIINPQTKKGYLDTDSLRALFTFIHRQADYSNNPRLVPIFLRLLSDEYNYIHTSTQPFFWEYPNFLH